MRFRIVELNVKTALTKSGLPDLDYALNPYIGCAHACLYCYAREYTSNVEIVSNWGYVVGVKKNLLDVLSREVKKVRRGVVGLGTITDGYQPVEALYRLSRKSIEILASNGFRISIQTKSSLILRDIDILKSYRDFVDVGLTITSTRNSSPMKFLEPFSTPPTARIETLKKLSSEGIRTWIFYGPIIPGYNDNIAEIVEVLKIARKTNSIVYFDKLRVKKFMWKSKALAQLARESLEYNWEEFFKKIQKLCKEMNIECRYGFENERNENNKKLDTYLRKT
ncbi:radical SAM protein [Ignisphaera sp. 4213-co]|uniref:Radical SAM protein n=1 Tax=Ignisphaera cupida TaxID=3050454 RepID=A0ABD4ZA12_9CREN|nr:radical SAM protein [Ignisphaera sp. 4213-co]MDK6029539.1 radical SAM protein [Ignisphaera sp. 4213-co]